MPKGKSSGNGKGKGKAEPGKIFPDPDPPREGCSTRTFEEERALRKLATKTSKKLLASLPPPLRQECLEQQKKKQIERILLPDAPPRKRPSRQKSPERAACRLVPGTPTTPPTPKLQPWELRKVKTVSLEDPDAPSTPTSANDYNKMLEVLGLLPLELPRVDWSTGNLRTDRPAVDQLVDSMTEEGRSLEVESPSNVLEPAPSPAAPRASPSREEVEVVTPPSTSSSKPTSSSSSSSSDHSSASSGIEKPGPRSKKLKRKMESPSNDPEPVPSAAAPRASPSREEVEVVPLPSTSSSIAAPSSSLPASDLPEEQGTNNFMWLLADDDDDMKQDTSVPLEDHEPRHLEADCFPELIPPEITVWLEQEDIAGDQAIRNLVEAGGAQLNYDFDWSLDRASFHGTREVFTGTPGPTFPVNAKTRPMEIFLRYFDNHLLDMLVRHTNRYATKLIDRNTKEKSRLLKFVNTDRAEMAVFIAILILQGLSNLTVEKDYWQENGFLTLKYFKDIMSLKRFQLLKRLLHFAPLTSDAADNNKLRKIAPVLDHLNAKFSELYRPGQDVAVDESLLKWHGRLSFTQRIATKAARVGVKSYELCESATGYLWRFFIYTGKGQLDSASNDDTEEQECREETEENLEPTRPSQQYDITVTAKIVRELVQPLFNLGHTVVMDNFYNSPLLARYLKAHGTDCFGTLRTNRQFVPESIKAVQKSMMRIGEVYQSYCRDLYIMMWRDSNVVSMISTYHEGEVGGKEKYGKFKYKPQVILDYNQTMGAIDRKDALLASQNIERSRNLVWYKKLFRRVLNATVLNSYIIAKTANKQLTHRLFRVQLANELIKTFKPQPIERPVVVQTASLVPVGTRNDYRRPILVGNHFIGEGPHPKARCVCCKNSRTKYICKQCNVSLCLLTCFENFHTKRDIL